MSGRLWMAVSPGMCWPSCRCRLEDAPWAYSFAYDPSGDVLYCNNRGHAGGPFLFGRLALKRWGDIEKIPPSDPADIQAEVLPAGNGAKVRWKPSSDASGIYTYRVFVDGALTYCTEQPEIVLSSFAWNQELKLAVQAMDAWQNLSAKAEHTVHLGGKPANAVLLKDLKSTTATFDGGAAGNSHGHLHRGGQVHPSGDVSGGRIRAESHPQIRAQDRDQRVWRPCETVL